MAIEKLYTTEEVTEVLKVNMQTVLKLIKQNKLKAKKIGREYRVKESDLQALLD